MASYTVKQTVVENLNADLDGKQPAGDYPTNASLTESLQSNVLNYTTNRILEIPQDIKLELNNGTLTLKAGSKVYALDGSSYTNPSDVTISYSNEIAHSSWIMVREDGTLDDIWTSESSSSITVGSKWLTFRDVNYYLPVALATHNADGTSKTGWKSIDQIFNGFGYIGSTVFALPGVKVQIPNGRNEDGTYRVIPYTTQNVITREVTGTGVKDITLQPNGILNWATGGLYLAEDGYLRGYIVNSANIAAVLTRVLITTAGKIDNFVPRNVDSVANSNASNFSAAGRSYLSGMGMPSSRYIDLTLGASGSTYTAPANGWFFMDVGLTDVKGAAQLSCGAIGASAIPQTGVSPSYALLPAHAGNVVKLTYGLSAKFNAFRFIYSKGEQ